MNFSWLLAYGENIFLPLFRDFLLERRRLSIPSYLEDIIHIHNTTCVPLAEFGVSFFTFLLLEPWIKNSLEEPSGI